MKMNSINYASPTSEVVEMHSDEGFLATSGNQLDVYNDLDDFVDGGLGF